MRRHRFLRVFLAALITATLFVIPTTAQAIGYWPDGVSYNAAATFDGGTGTEGDPYIIKTEASLTQLAVNVSYDTEPLDYYGVYFRLDKDLNLAGAAWLPIGLWESGTEYPFSGNFDGNGHKISNMIIDESTQIGVGLFGYTTDDALIEDLGVENCDVTGQARAGGLVGLAKGSSIHNCYTTGTVTAVYNDGAEEEEYNGGFAGGLVGSYEIAPSTIDGCWSSADIHGKEIIGGLVGYSNMSHIKNSYATGDVGGSTEAYTAGGFIGLCEQSEIEHCYATGSITGEEYVGGFLGAAYSDGSDNQIVNCYARGDVTLTYEQGRYAGSFTGNAYDTDFYNCYGSGNVSYSGTNMDYICCIGGFSGYMGENVTFTSCFFDNTVTGREAVGENDSEHSHAQAGITGLSTANMKGYDTLTSASKMDSLDSGDGAPVAGVPVWYPHTGDYPTFTGENCSITFDSQGAGTAALPAVKSTIVGNTLDALPSDPAKAGNIFGGWWTVVNGGGTQFIASTPAPGDITVYAQWTELKLSSSDTDGKIYTGGRITLTPNVDGGTWDWDHSFFTATFNSPATFTALKTGTSVITYTVGSGSVSYNVTIEASGLPNTGQDFTWVYLLSGAVMIVLAAVPMITRCRKRAL